jgi:AcrR family transcriptional regulator
VGAILQAAEEVFADQGLHAAPMGDIAARAGVAVGTLYNYFEDREALLAGLLASRRSELVGQVDARLKAMAKAGPAEKLRAVMEALLAHLQGHRRFMYIVMQGETVRHQTGAPAAAGRLPSETVRELLGRIEPIIKQGVRAGLVRADLAELGPMLFLSMVRAVALRDVLQDGAGELVSEAERLVGFFLRGASP